MVLSVWRFCVTQKFNFTNSFTLSKEKCQCVSQQPLESIFVKIMHKNGVIKLYNHLRSNHATLVLWMPHLKINGHHFFLPSVQYSVLTVESNSSQLKGKGHPLTVHEGPRGGGWSAPCPGCFTSGKDPVPIVQEAGWAPGPVWTCAKNLTPTGIWSVDCPARSQSLYRLSYLAHNSSQLYYHNSLHLFISFIFKIFGHRISSFLHKFEGYWNSSFHTSWSLWLSHNWRSLRWLRLHVFIFFKTVVFLISFTHNCGYSSWILKQQSLGASF
jgi:hypothetical protein